MKHILVMICNVIQNDLYTVSQTPLLFSDIFSQTLGNF